MLDPTLMRIDLRKLTLRRRDHFACVVEDHRPATRRALIDREEMVSAHGVNISVCYFGMMTNSYAYKAILNFAVLPYMIAEQKIGEAEDGAQSGRIWL